MFYKTVTGTGDHANVLDGQKKLMAIRVVDIAEDAIVTMDDDITVTAGNPLGELVTCHAFGIYVDKQNFTPNGILLERGLSINITGAGAAVYIYYA